MDLGDSFSIAKFKQGDERQFNIVYSKFEDPLYLYAMKLIKNHSDADDVVSKAMIALWRNMERMETSFQISNFLYATVLNECIDRRRRRRAEIKRVQYFPDHDNIAPAVEGPSHDRYESLRAQIAKEDLIMSIGVEVERLPKKCRRIFKMKYFDDKSVSVISAELGIKESTVYEQITIAKRKLRKALVKKAVGKLSFWGMIPLFLLIMSW